MIILLVFSFFAGLITVLSPCILPVLPLLLAASASQGKYRLYAIIAGLIISFTFFTLTLTSFIQITGLSADSLRIVSIIVIIFFGLTMLFSTIEQIFTRITTPITRLGSNLQDQTTSKTGVFSGFLLGIALGLIWTPCAGPILATISVLAATGMISLKAFVIILVYSIGTAIPIFFIMYGSASMTRFLERITSYTEYIRKIFGIVMILSGLAIWFHADIILQEFVARYIPVTIVEHNSFIEKELEKLKEESLMEKSTVQEGSKAPDFTGISAWINTPPVTIANLKGKVVLIDFWTYSCINCIRTLPFLKKWYTTYKDNGFTIIGIHSPEFAFEREVHNVQSMVNHFGITYPVALDNDYKTWQAYDNHYWPAHYLIDQKGIIQYIHFGEGSYDETENKIRALLGLSPLKETYKQAIVTQQTPEIYLGYQRAARYASAIRLQPNKGTTYNYIEPLDTDEVGLSGQWYIGPESITAQGNQSKLSLNFIAQHVYLVMSAQKRSLVTVYLDNRLITDAHYSKDMNNKGQIIVEASRMYTIVDLKDVGRHTVTLSIPDGVSLYAFTFGAD